MFKFLAAVLATATLAFAAAAPEPPVSAERTLVLYASIHGPMGYGRAVYEERPSIFKVTQALAVRVVEAEPEMSYKVLVNGTPVGEIVTDAKGCGSGYFTSPPDALPRVRAGASIVVGPLAGRFTAK